MGTGIPGHVGEFLLTLRPFIPYLPLFSYRYVSFCRLALLHERCIVFCICNEPRDLKIEKIYV